jgi:proteinaceous RNase P
VLITNDELRDHVFQMLPAPRLFYKWKERHQVRFTITGSEVTLRRPAPFTTCVQENVGWWAFPSAESTGCLIARKREQKAGG